MRHWRVKGSTSSGRWISAALFACLLVPGWVLAQTQRDLPKLGVLWITDPVTAEPYLGSVKTGLRALGWIDGRTIRVIERYDYGEVSRRPALAAELVELRVDLLLVASPALPAAREAAKNIPIVCADFYDPIAEGATTSMARPDRNVTGISWQSVDSASKRLQLTKELLPHARRIGMMFDANDVGAVVELRGVAKAAQELGVTVQRLELRTPRDIEPTLVSLKGSQLQALIVSGGTLTWPAIDRIVQAATANRMPVISEPHEFAAAGALMTYGPDIPALYRRSASFVDRILKGAKPSDLPIEQPTEFDLVVNLRTAKALGLTLPPSIMERSTRVIR